MLPRVSLTLWILAAGIGLGSGLGPVAADTQTASEGLEAEQLEAPLGVWMPDDGESKVEFYSCDNSLCGRISWLKDEYDKDGKLLTDIYNPNPALRSVPVVGLVIMYDITPTDEEGVWEGRVYNPRDGRTYDFWLTVESESQIMIEGCGLYGLICQTHMWDRAEP
jgi:uncharacterized protein (DUF2147 family)